jgi:hypothetical protein
MQETMAQRKAARQAEKDALARGEVPETLKGWRNYSSKEDEQGTSGLVVPLLPFGIRKYDEVSGPRDMGIANTCCCVAHTRACSSGHDYALELTARAPQPVAPSRRWHAWSDSAPV